MNKNKLPHILNFLFYLQNHFAVKKLRFDNDSFLFKLRKFARGTFPNASQKDVLNYITSRNMSKTIMPPLNGKNVANRYAISPLSVKEIINSIYFNWEQAKKVFSSASRSGILKIHTTTNHLGNLITKKPEGKSHVEDEESWGGPEAFKLLIFLKEDFDTVIRKYPSVIVLFHAPWCPHCLRLKKPYGNAAVMAKEAKLPMVFAVFDVTINPDIADEKGVVGIPVIKYYKKGKYVTTYGGKRTAEGLFEFVKNPPLSSSSELKRPDV